jgi:hypothetical protein
MSSIDALSLRVLVQSSTLISLNFSLITFVSIADKSKQFLTFTQKTTIVKIERLRSARLIQVDKEITTRHAKSLNKTNNS